MCLLVAVVRFVVRLVMKVLNLSCSGKWGLEL